METAGIKIPTIMKPASFTDRVGSACRIASVSLMTGLFLRSIAVSFCWPFLGHGAALLSIRLAMNLSKEYNKRLLNDLASKTSALHDAFPSLRAATFLVALVASSLFPMLSLAAGFALGTATALTLDLELCHKRQKIQDAKGGKKASLATFINQLV